MARIRTIKPEFWRHEELSELPEATHLLAAALLNYADDHGYFNANPALIKAECSPLREPSVSIHESLTHLSSIGYIQLGKCPNGRRIGRVVAFDKHQRVNRPSESKFAGVSITWDAEKRLTESSVNAHGALTAGTGNREQGRGTGKGKEPALPACATDEPLVEDAKAAVEYLNGRCNREFRASDSSLRHPIARLKAGMTLADLKRIVDFKAGQWLGDPERQEYLRPETLFGTKAEGYLQAARAANDPSHGVRYGRRKGRAELAWDEFAAAHGLDGDSAVLADLDIGPEGPNGRLGAGAGWPDAATGDARDSDALDLERGLPAVAGEVPRNLHRLPRA